MSSAIESDQLCQVCLSHPRCAFRGLSIELLELVHEAKTTQVFQPGQTILSSGSPPAGVHCIISGTARLQVHSKEGKLHLLGFAKDGFTLGLNNLFSEKPGEVEAVAHTLTQACFIPKQILLQMMEKSPSFAEELLKRVASCCRELEQKLLAAREKSVTMRIAEALVRFTEDYGVEHWTRKDLAEWSGTTIETVIRVLADFELQGMIRKSGRKVEVVNPGELRRISQVTAPLSASR